MTLEQCRIGILGGTFDPPHLSHLEMARRVHQLGLVDRVLMVPCFRHAFDKQPVSFTHRLKMCRCMTADLDFVDVSDAEQYLDTPGRTLALIEILEKQYPGCTLRLLVGGDIYLERHQWYRFDLVEQKAPPIYLARAGVDVRGADWLAAPPSMSSGDIRARLARGEDVDRLLAPTVMAYIVEHQLYGV
ncbi:MAG: nicotinate-nicotinamide nucleotide adenylyltransferase [Deltaproteobacteria bacterium]|nr:nicotinate-nicotinamide nucleotide adenylyltransferase [Deltaproteobacteria bacterium]